MALTNRNPLPITLSNPRSPVTEAYRTIRTNLQFASVVDDVQVVMTTSSLPGEGKTSTVSNLAVVTAQSGKRVLLIDADMRKPQIHQRFHTSNLTGLSSILIKESSLEECTMEGAIDGLFILPSGPIPPNPSELLSSKPFTRLIEACREQYDLILVDSPPVLSVADGLALTRSVDGVVFVVDAQNTNRVMAKKAVDSLQQIGARILGVVLNKAKRNAKDSYYYYNYYSSNHKVNV
ncbi:CpsD/CapB family tyrosine-protein kinase [Alicyclobacillus tolerans]|uniref:CpsD/CapB family tyrosine-protein kinase n=1 Tax=Alicyclobacillus tolerans TaxID=90970 RepID=UPI001F299033|nr:CpsD/CapB family tyrosine-protein kinase [Alicyclobacillus tolerans]MCF8566821.1 CpsD/CapB family tyrosine-protein kinase [Alicyclobacillus tolerans]